VIGGRWMGAVSGVEFTICIALLGAPGVDFAIVLHFWTHQTSSS
jgi:hypothetical protein